MIILRYLSREVLQTTLAVSGVLLLIIMCGRFVKYLADAAAGKLDASVLILVMAYRLPNFLELILPLAFFVALLLAYGRLYTDHEMTVLSACGMSRKQLLAYTALPTGVIVVIVALLSLWLTPLGLQKAGALLAAQKNRSDFETMQPGRFQSLQGGHLASYAEAIADDQTVLESVFMAQNGAADKPLLVIRSQTGRRIDHPQYGQRYLLLGNGIRYEGRPGSANYRITEFSNFGQHIPAPVIEGITSKDVDMLDSTQLLRSAKKEHRAALQWRVSIPLLVVVVMFLGVALSYTNPRRGRYAKLFPSIILYLIYLVALNGARGALEEGRLSASFGLWGVHGLFFVIALLLLVDAAQWQRWFSRRRTHATA